MTLKALYQLSTGDLVTHQRTIAAHFARLDDRRQRVIRRRLEGATLREIGRELRISVGSVRKWWNWQTHHLEGVAPKGVGVQIPPSAP